jgi:hypothetical protein
MGKLFFIVLVILGAVIAIPASRDRIADYVNPVVDGFRAKMVPSRLEVMADQLDVRIQRGQGLPGNFEGWLRRDFSAVPVDPWGNVWYLDVGRRGYTVGSMGPDGRKNTDDDITVERREGRR